MGKTDPLVNCNDDEPIGASSPKGDFVYVPPTTNAIRQQQLQQLRATTNGPEDEEDDGEGNPEEDRLLNGSCPGAVVVTYDSRKPRSLPKEESLPLNTDIERADKFAAAEDSLPSPVIPGPSPPDGGLRAWMVMIASFLCNGILFGTINSVGVIFVELKKVLDEEGVENPAARTSIIVSLGIGTTFFLSMAAGVFTDKFGIRFTTITGGAIATLGMFLSSLYYTQPSILLVTFGVLFGIGASLAYTPSLVILGHYFFKRLGIVNGFVTAGSSLFTILITPLLKFIVANYGLKTVFQVLTGLMSALMVCGFIFKPFLPDLPNTPSDDQSKDKQGGKSKSKFINLEIWKNKRYVIWALAIPSALFGYFVPYAHLVAFVTNVLGDDAQGQILVQCIGGTSFFGRLFFGFIADSPRVNRIMLQQISFFSIGILTMLLVAANKFWMFVAISLGMGFFDGCFISLLGPIAFDTVGPAGASQAIGFLLAFCSIPLTLGPFLAGLIYDMTGSYFIPFLCAGVPPIMGCFALFLMRCVKVPPAGGVGSPVREVSETKNNVVSVNLENANLATGTMMAEAQAASVDNQQSLARDSLKIDGGLIDSAPSREMATEMKNNMAAANLGNNTNPSTLEDVQHPVTIVDGNPLASVGAVDLLQVDVRHLVNLQRESSV